MYKNILIPIAMFDKAKAEGSLRVAQALRDADGKVTLLHVMEQIPAYLMSEIPEEILKRNRTGAQEALTALAASTGYGPAIDIVTGHAARTILDYAQDHKNDCIVLASHRPGLEDYFLGSTASHVVRHATCAVHVLR